MSGKLNIKAFAEQLGVSTATVSRAFSTKGRISDKTRRHILEKARELGYAANIHASRLSARDSDIIGLFYPARECEHPDFFITEIQHGVQGKLLNSGKLLQTHPIPDGTDNDNLIAEYVNYILSGGLGGVIVVAGSTASRTLAQAAKNAQIPYTVIGHMSGEGTCAVSFDNSEGAQLAGRYFLKTGRRHPAYVGGHLDKRKLKGFISGLGDAASGLLLHPGGNSFNHGAAAFNEIFAARPEIDCVLCANDILAAGFLKAAAAAGVRIPERMALIGFDDTSFSRYLTPSLSSVSLNLTRIGTLAAAQILRALHGDNIEPEYVNCELILRESS